MSKCDLEIILDKSDETYSAKEEVRGRVKVTVNQDVRADDVEVSLRWETSGKGNRARETGVSTSLGSFEWRAGQTQELPFKLRLPQGPPSYSGTYINLDWKVLAQVDIPWAIDPKAECEFIMKPTRPDSDVEAQKLLGKPANSTARIIAIGFLFFMFVFVSSVMGPAILGVINSESSMSDSLFVLVQGAVFVGVSFFILATIAKPWIAQLRTGKLKVDINKMIVSPGDTVNVSAAFQARSALCLNNAKLSLQLREIAVSGSGTNRTTHTHEETITTIELSQGERFAAGQPFREQGRFKIPDAAAPSFRVGSNEVRWVVVTDLDIDNWPDLNRETTIVVR
jgi:sporulation-control protein spo0M